MGWGVFLCYFELVRVLSEQAVRPALVGGIVYSVGAVLNHLGWPALWPGVFSAHEVWHLFVMAGSLAHYLLILQVVVPFRQEAGEVARVRNQYLDYFLRLAEERFDAFEGQRTARMP